jgi:hypothetical protein
MLADALTGELAWQVIQRLGTERKWDDFGDWVE